ncbi:MAG TPA: phosphoadenylyl-sulfate reductase [Opitutaceae bacterium]|nr:phosphoadenylyl-sulfate reductase [Opitutaceae bacterium]
MNAVSAGPAVVTDVEHLESQSAEQRVRWALETFGPRLVLTTSFGIQSAVMLHLVTRVAPEIPVIFVDTGYLFPETYRFARDLTERLGLNLKTYVPRATAAQQEALYGKQWEQGLDGLKRYNLINKVEPMDRAMRELGATAWLAGLRRVQASTRENLKVVQAQNKVTKIHPILDWDNRKIHRYLTEFDLPYHPLWDQGYVSVGDVHSTSKLEPGMTEEQTRFGGLKRECGLHEESGKGDFQI